MAPFEETFHALARRASSDSSAAPAQDRAALEADLEPLVRRALSHGTGVPALVNWVRRALPRVTGGASAVRPADYSGALARLLCRTLLERGRPQARPSGADWDTVAGR